MPLDDGVGFLDMPQPINKIVPDPYVYLDTNALSDKPELANLVCQIFATWSSIEQELNFLFFVVLGADAAPAIAIYTELRTQHLQLVALEAAAKAALADDDYLIFKAASSVAASVQTPRNHLAHWTWGRCKQRHDLLVLANPQMLKERDFRVATHIAGKPLDKLDPLEVAALHLFNDDEILAYSKGDLERALRDMEEAQSILQNLRLYLDPRPIQVLSKTPGGTIHDKTEIRCALLQRLDDQRLFREALARMRAGREKPRERQNASRSLGPAGS